MATDACGVLFVTLLITRERAKLIIMQCNMESMDDFQDRHRKPVDLVAPLPLERCGRTILVLCPSRILYSFHEQFEGHLGSLRTQ